MYVSLNVSDIFRDVNNISFLRYVVLIFDEMKIKEDLVYDKTGHHLHGFVNLGEVNNQLLQLEKNVGVSSGVSKPHKHMATEMLTLMVRGIFIKLEYPYASFPATGNTAYTKICTITNSHIF